MELEEIFNRQNILDISFFNFRNAVTACYFADRDLRVLRVNDNFKAFFPVLGNVTNAFFLTCWSKWASTRSRSRPFNSSCKSRVASSFHTSR